MGLRIVMATTTTITKSTKRVSISQNPASSPRKLSTERPNGPSSESPSLRYSQITGSARCCPQTSFARIQVQTPIPTSTSFEGRNSLAVQYSSVRATALLFSHGSKMAYRASTARCFLAAHSHQGWTSCPPPSTLHGP